MGRSVSSFFRRVCISLVGFFLAGCHRHELTWDESRLEGLRVRAEAHLVGPSRDTISIWVTSVNTTAQTRSLSFSACGDVTARVMSTKVRNGRPLHIWDYAATLQRPRMVPGEISFGCSLIMSTALKARDSVTLVSLSFPVSKVLGDSLPPGRYRVVAYPRVQSAERGFPAGELDLRLPGPE
jgi:hypothetical protein